MYIHPNFCHGKLLLTFCYESFQIFSLHYILQSFSNFYITKGKEPYHIYSETFIFQLTMYSRRYVTSINTVSSFCFNSYTVFHRHIFMTGEGNSNPLQYSCLEKNLVGYSPWGCKELDTTERLTHTHTHTYLWHSSYHYHK